MRLLLGTDINLLPEETGRTLSYFSLMFLFRGMPFIDLAHLRKRDVQGNMIVYCRHKTGRQMTVRIPKEAIPLMKKFADKRPSSLYLFPILDIIRLMIGSVQFTDYMPGIFHHLPKPLIIRVIRVDGFPGK